MRSNWEETKARSTYHFDPTVKDNPADCVQYLGNIRPNWDQELKDIIANARPATWATRGYKGEGVEAPPDDLKAEEYDMERIGMNPKMHITHLNWKIPPVLQSISDDIGLKDCMNRIHVQMPGEMWNLHIDKLYKWAPDNPSQVVRVFIQLTDWQPGQFWEFGNYHWNQWSAGDLLTFDWTNMPHCTANAGMHPRVTFQLTGIKTKKTEDFLNNI